MTCEADYLEVRKFGEEVVSPCHGHLRGNQIYLEVEEREREMKKREVSRTSSF